jgi:hypothetical protein
VPPGQDQHLPRVESVHVSQGVDGDDGLDERGAPAEVVGGALRCGDHQAVQMPELVRRDPVLADEKAGVRANPVGGDDLGRRAERGAAGAEQFGGGEPAQRAVPGDEQVRGAGEQLEVDVGGSRHVDVGKEAAEARAAQHARGEEAGGDRVRAAEGFGEIHGRH